MKRRLANGLKKLGFGDDEPRFGHLKGVVKFVGRIGWVCADEDATSSDDALDEDWVV